jgi:hypothetical protein
MIRDNRVWGPRPWIYVSDDEFGHFFRGDDFMTGDCSYPLA